VFLVVAVVMMREAVVRVRRHEIPLEAGSKTHPMIKRAKGELKA
jgi:hypothetical protein